jgi:outer membrane protein assembly factor BamB
MQERGRKALRENGFFSERQRLKGPPGMLGTKKKAFLLAACALLVAGGVGGYLLWRDSRNPEDTSSPMGTIPGACGQTPLPALDSGDSNWPCWRGETRNSRSAVEKIRSDWSGGLKLLWSVDYLCQGKRASTWSAPVARGTRLVVPGRGKDTDLLFCLDSRTGDLLWKGSHDAEAGNDYGPGARATPFIDEDRVYTFGRSGDLVCWSLYDGHKVWHRNVTDEGGVVPQWGFSSSPLVHGGRVFVQGKGALGIAFDKVTGEVEWQSTKPGDSGYAAPVIEEIDGKTQLLMFHGTGLSAVDPRSGAEFWSSEWKTRFGVNATTPTVADGVIFVTSDYGMGCGAFQVEGGKVRTLWKSDVIAAHHSDPLVLDGCLYGYSGMSNTNRGRFKCVELKTGLEKWSTDKVGNGTTLYVAGFLLNLDYKGNLFLVKPHPERFILEAEFRNAIPEVKQMSWTAPIVANGRLFLRYRQRLICYDLTVD